MDKTKKKQNKKMKRTNKRKNKTTKRKPTNNNNKVKLLPEIKPEINIIDNAVNNRSSNQNNERNIQTQPRRPRIYKGKIVGYKTVKKPIREYDMAKIQKREEKQKIKNDQIKLKNDNNYIFCQCGMKLKKENLEKHINNSQTHKEVLNTYFNEEKN